MKCVVTFRPSHGPVRHPLDWMLKEGFKHCAIAVRTAQGWIEIDYAIGVPIVKVIAGRDFDIEQWYKNQGFITFTTKQAINKHFRFNLFRGNMFVSNCVGLVKAILGVSYFSITPYQLYKRLKKCH
jgi:hypothetical protein